MFRLLFLVLSLISISLAQQDCASCIAAGKKWCAAGNSVKCEPGLTAGCTTVIRDADNCPLAPATGYEYNETFARYTVLPLIAAVYAKDPTECLRNQLPSTVFSTSVRVQCYPSGPNSTCHAYTAYDNKRKAIIVSFEGTEGAVQMTEEVEAFFHNKTSFYGEGHVFEYFYNAFFFLWNGGLETSVRNLQFLYPDYELWVVGHSMGAAISSVFASYALKQNMYTPDKLKLVTFGQPRTGDEDFAKWHDKTFLYSYRIVHHKDPAPHVPPMGGKDQVYHHRYEVWYNNAMKVGDPYTVCPEADGPYCSNTQLETIGEDHVVYFDKNLGTWSSIGCPQQ